MSDSVTPWTAARQASLSITNSQSLLRLMSIELVMPSNHLILCHPLLLLPSIFPSIRSFPVSQFSASGGQSIRASASVLPTNVQDWFPLELTGLISLLSKGLSRVFSRVFNTSYYYLILSQDGNPLQCSCLENPMDRGAWQAAVHGVTKSWIWLSSYTDNLSPELLQTC